MSATSEGLNLVKNFDFFTKAGFNNAHDFLKNYVAVTDGGSAIYFTASANYATLLGLLITTGDGDIRVPQKPEATCAQGNVTICTDFKDVAVGSMPAGFDGSGRNPRVASGEQAYSGAKSLKLWE